MAKHPQQKPTDGDPAHAEGHRHLPPPPKQARRRSSVNEPAHDQPWIPKDGMARGRSR
jgi:hypothetical protein